MALTVTEILAPVGQGVTPATILTATFTGSANVGDYVFATVLLGSTGTLPTPTDSVGNTYVLDQQDANTTASMRHGIARCLVSKPIVSGSTTLSLSTAAIIKGFAAVVVRSPGLLLELDKTNKVSNSATATSMTTGASGTLVTPLEFAVASYGWGNTTSTFTETAGWTNPHGAGVKISTTSTVFEAATQYSLPTLNTTLNPTATLGTTNPWAGEIITYRIMNQYAYSPTRIANINVGPPAQRQLYRQPQLPRYQDAVVVGPVSASITQVAAVVTATGGTQTVATPLSTSVTQVAATVTATGGTQTVATVNNVTIAQVAATVTASGGTQIIVTLQNSSIAQLAATVTASGGSQTVASSQIVAISQLAANVTTTGGTQTLATVQNSTISQVATTVTTTGGSQAVSAGTGGATSATVAQVAGTVTATGGTPVSQSSTGPVNNYPKLIFDIEGNPYLRVTAHEYLKL